MTSRLIATLLVMAGSTWVWGADTRETLDRARVNYRQSVSQYGQNSPQARKARTNLRSARHTFHSERRRRAMNQYGGRRNSR